MNKHRKLRLYKLYRRMWGKDWLDQEIRLSRFKRIPWRIVCAIVGHEWGEKGPVITAGPLGAPPRERDYHVLTFHQQCKRCYDIEDAPYTVFEKLAAIEESIREDEHEWPAVQKYFLEKETA